MSTPVDGLPGELVRGHETEAAVRAVAVVVEQPVVHGDLDVVVVVEVPAVGELLPEARVEALDDAVLPGTARIDVDGLDALLGHEAGDDALGELVDDEEDAQGASLPRAQHHEVPRPDLVGSGGLALMQARGASAAAHAGLRGCQLHPGGTPDSTDLTQPHAIAELAHVADDLAMALGREGEREGDHASADLRDRCSWPRTVSQGVAVHVQRPADQPLRCPGQAAGDATLRARDSRHQRPHGRRCQLLGHLAGELPHLPRAQRFFSRAIWRMRIWTACSATTRAMCSIVFSCSRILAASGGASRCS
ncbi:MAG: hypothetical protein RJA48_1042 [Verrucomicrobiota bacterium]